MDHHNNSQCHHNNNKAIIRTRPRNKKPPTFLQSHAWNRTSQNGEDGILEKLLEHSLYQRKRGNHENIYWLVDVGAWDGQHLSNTYHLMHPTRSPTTINTPTWNAIFIEADDDKFAALQELYRDNPHATCVHAMVSVLPDHPLSLSRLLLSHQILPRDFDFLCIDIDGNDYWVLHDIIYNHQFRPNIVCIEFNPTMPDTLIYIPPPHNDHVRHGASLAAIVEFMQLQNYTLVETTLFNAFFVTNDLYQQYLTQLIPDTTIETLHTELSLQTHLYQLYNGRLKLHGCQKLLWHRHPIREEQIQVLQHSSDQSFPFAPRTQNKIHSQRDINNNSHIIIIDMSECFHETYENNNHLPDCAFAFLDALLEQDGFCFVRGIPNNNQSGGLVQDTLHAAAQFLYHADESVRRSCRSSSPHKQGYSPMNTENFARLIGKMDQPNDLVRKFRIGCPSSPNNKNVWPSKDLWSESESFQRVVEEYYRFSNRAGLRLLEVLCRALMERYNNDDKDTNVASGPNLAASLQPVVDACQEALSSAITSTTSILTLLGYQVGTRHRGRNKGPLVAEHTDVGFLTLLQFDHKDSSCAILQRKQKGDKNDMDSWVNVVVEDVEDVFCVNVADCLSLLSGNRLPSLVHRVVVASHQPRHAAALFVGLPTATVLNFGKYPHDDNNNFNHSDNDNRMTFEEWRRKRIQSIGKAK